MAEKVCWEVADITDWHPRRKLDVWHDRAVFHFLTEPSNERLIALRCCAELPKAGWSLLPPSPSTGRKNAAGFLYSDMTQSVWPQRWVTASSQLMAGQRSMLLPGEPVSHSTGALSAASDEGGDRQTAWLNVSFPASAGASGASAMGAKPP